MGPIEIAFDRNSIELMLLFFELPNGGNNREQKFGLGFFISIYEIFIIHLLKEE